MEELPKRCKGCEQEYPATPEYWNKNADCRDGLVGKCKKCTSARDKERRNIPEVKAHTQARKKSYRSRPEVKEHIQEYQKAYNARPEVKKHRREYLEERRVETQGYMKNYYKRYYGYRDVRRRILDQHKEYQSRQDVKRRTQEYQKAYRTLPKNRRWRKEYRSRPEAQELIRANNRNRRARKRSVSGKHSPQQIQEQLKRQKYRCYYAACGRAKFKKVKGKYVYHVEHTFPLSRVAGTDIPANGIDYIVLACPACNLSKGDKLPWEWADGGRLC